MAVTTYGMQDLERLSGLSGRTIRTWMAKKLLPRGSGKARATVYDDRHVRRLRVIRLLRNRNEKLSTIRSQLAHLSEAQLDEMIMKGTTPAVPTTMPDAPAAPVYPATTCEVIALMDGLTLTVDPSKGELVQRVAAAIYRHYAHRC